MLGCACEGHSDALACECISEHEQQTYMAGAVTKREIRPLGVRRLQGHAQVSTPWHPSRACLQQRYMLVGATAAGDGQFPKSRTRCASMSSGVAAPEQLLHACRTLSKRPATAQLARTVHWPQQRTCAYLDVCRGPGWRSPLTYGAHRCNKAAAPSAAGARSAGRHCKGPMQPPPPPAPSGCKINLVSNQKPVTNAQPVSSTPQPHTPQVDGATTTSAAMSARTSVNFEVWHSQSEPHHAHRHRLPQVLWFACRICAA